ncbi:MAG: ComF family protein [Myxococcota bacterium]
MHRVLSALLDLVFPSRCAACDRPVAEPGLCHGCADTTLAGTDACCPLCGAVWLDPPPGEAQHVCGRCLAEPPPWVEARGAYAYGGALQDAIARWKNKPDESIGRPLARLFAAAAPRAGWVGLAADAVVVPVPASARGLAQRGFNPAGVLGRGLARGIQRRFEPTALRLRRTPEKSHGLGRRARERRMRGVFEAEPRRVAGRTIVLVDDVMTTGATVRAATEALLRAGARGVRVAVLARVPG